MGHVSGSRGVSGGVRWILGGGGMLRLKTGEADEWWWSLRAGSWIAEEW